MFRKQHYILALLLCCSFSGLLAQIKDTTRNLTKGVELVSQKENDTSFGRGFALLIGVSNYSYLPRLNYTDDDVYAFSNVLQSNPENRFNKKDIHILIDREATKANIKKELNLIFSNISDGDRFVFYFSGHGDAEKNSSKGYLLCVDCMPKTYMDDISDALSIEELNSILLPELANKKVKVYFIIDACKAGHGLLNFNNDEHTYKGNHSDQVFKLLSSHEKQESIERIFNDEGGRGVFSYYLTKGLSGAADINNDTFVDMYEIERYIDESIYNFPAEFNGGIDIQTPAFYFASKKENVLKVNRSNINVKSDSTEYNNFSSASRSIMGDNTDRFLANEGLSSRFPDLIYNYRSLFVSSETNVLTNHNRQIEHFIKDYNDFISSDISKEIKAEFQNMLIADISNLSQSFFNEYLDGSLFNHISDTELTDKLFFISSFNDFLIESVLPAFDDEKNFLSTPRNYFTNRGKFIKAYINFRKGTRDSFEESISLLNEILSYSQDKSYAYNLLGMVYIRQRKFDDALKALRKAIHISPSWSYPYRNTGALFNSISQRDSVIYYYNIALELNNRDAILMNNLGNYYFSINNYNSSEKYYRDAVNFDTAYSIAWNNLGRILLYKENIDSAKFAFSRSLSYAISEKDKIWPSINMASSFLQQNRYNDCRDYLDSAEIYSHSRNDFVYFWKGIMYSIIGKSDSALYFYRKSGEMNEMYSYESDFAIANEYFIRNSLDSCQFYLNKVCENSFSSNEAKSRAFSALAYLSYRKSDYKTVIELLDNSEESFYSHPDLVYAFLVMNIRFPNSYRNLTSTQNEIPEVPFCHFKFHLDKVFYLEYINLTN